MQTLPETARDGRIVSMLTELVFIIILTEHVEVNQQVFLASTVYEAVGIYNQIES